MEKVKWLTNSQGMVLSPEKERSERALRARRKRKTKTNKDSYSNRKLTRKCPKCGSIITKKRTLNRNDEIGIFRDSTTVYICDDCLAVWSSKQVIKIWQRLKKNPTPSTNKDFKNKLKNAF